MQSLRLKRAVKLKREHVSDDYGQSSFLDPIIVKIRAILTIFRSFEDFRFSRRALSITHINYRELPLIFVWYLVSFSVI